MRKHTQEFKEKIKIFGRRLDSKLTFGEITLGNEQLNNITPVVQSSLLKSVMKELDIDSNINIPIGTIVNYQFGILLDSGDYEYLDFGNYQVYSSEKQEDNNAYNIIAYDKMLNSMIEYEELKSKNKSFPMTVRDYINAICGDIGLVFANAETEFANYDKIIPSDLYANLGYTYRDILDELAQVTASNIVINENDELEIKYITNTEDTIDEEYLKDINVKFGEKYGPINSIVLSRSAESDNVYLQDEQSIVDNGLCELKIKDNQIMNFNDRSDYLPDILEKLNGLQYFINDFSSTGICYYEVADRYNVKVGENTYTCIMFNDECEISQGLEETIFTDMPEQAETDYTKADKTDRRINQTYLIVDKQNQQIEGLVNQTTETTERVSKVEINIEHILQQIQSIEDLVIRRETNSASMNVDNVANGYLLKLQVHPIWVLESDGNYNIAQTYPNNNIYPSNNMFTRTTIGTLRIENLTTKEIIDYEIPTDLYYLDENTYDVLDYEYGNEKCIVTRNITFVDGQPQKLTNPIKEEYDFPVIDTKEGNYKISLLDYTQAYIYVELIGKNDLTDIYATKRELNTSITQTNEKIELEVSEVNKLLEEEVQTLNSTITQTASSITEEVNGRFQTVDGEFKDVKASIELKVNTKDLCSEINASADKISLKSNRFSWQSTNSSMTEDGTLTAQNAVITGKITATSGSFKGKIEASEGTIGGCTIANGTLKIGNKNIEDLSADKLNSGEVKSCDINIYNGTGFLRMRNGTAYNPYVSALNVAHGAGGISFRSSGNRDSTGSQIGQIYADNNVIYLSASNGVHIDNYLKCGNIGISDVQIDGADDTYIRLNRSVVLKPHPNGGAYIWGTEDYNKILTSSGSPSSLSIKESVQKKDISDIPQILEQIDLYDYKYVDEIENGKEDYGYIIDYLEQIEGIDKYFKFNSIERNEIKYKTINHEHLSKFLLGAVIELQKQVNELKK